jgi:pimeloyl-ACP methyl ester carboxylesterase
VSGPGISPAAQEIYRVEHELRADGFPEEEVSKVIELYNQLLQLLREGRSFDEIAAALPIEEMKAADWAPYMPELEPAGATFMKGIMDYDPRSVLGSVTCPFLGIWGETDRLVPALQSAEIFRQDMEAAGNTDFTLKIFADADHGIYTSETGSRKERAARRERDELNFAPGYFALMKDWLQDRFYAPVTTASRSHFPDVS